MLIKNRHEGSGRSTVIGLLLVLSLGMILGLYLGSKSKSLKLADLERKILPAQPAPEPAPAIPPPLPPLPAGQQAYEQSIIAVAERAMPAVVNVSVEKVVRSANAPFFNDPFFRRFGGQMPAQQRRESGMGSGVIITSDGYILTNNHVVAGVDQVEVLLGDRRRFEARIIGTDPKSDLALIKIEGENLPYLPWGDSDQIRLGQTVLAIGNPFGLNQTITQGIISAKGRAQVGIADYEDFIQTDAAINPGNSGGALVNLQGELIGVNTAIASRTGGYEGIGFAIPSNMAKTIMDMLIKDGKVVRGFVGVSMQEITPSLAKTLGLADVRGTLVADVIPGRPADQAGLQAGDVIVEADGKPIEDMMRFRNQVALTPPGSQLRLKIRRLGDTLEKIVTVGELAEADGESPLATPTSAAESDSPLGISVTNLTPEIAGQLNLDSLQTGVLITRVRPGGRAAEAGLQQGDLITEVNRRPVENIGTLRQALEAAPEGPVLFVVKRQGSNFYVAVE